MTHASLAASALLLPVLALAAKQDPERIDWERLSRRLDRNRDGVLTPADFGEEEPDAPGACVRRATELAAPEDERLSSCVSIHDWHATILHLVGLDHERLTYPHAGRDVRLTDVHGRVVHEMLI